MTEKDERERLERLDPRDLIGEAYRMPGLTARECRAVFFDWALGRGPAEGSPEAARALRDRYAPKHPGHPMTAILNEAASAPQARARPRRRGGRRGRAPGA